MKKIGIIFIAAILTLALSACGRNKKSEATDPQNESRDTTPTLVDPTILDPTMETNIPDPSVDTRMPDMTAPSASTPAR